MGMTRGQAAKTLGLSVRRLRDLELTGRLRPVGKKGQRRIFDEEEIARYARGRGLRPRIPIAEPGKAPTYFVDHETAAKIFDRLAMQMKKIEIVRELRVHPHVVEQIGATYDRMRLESGDAIPMRCAKCRENAARFCGACCG